MEAALAEIGEAAAERMGTAFIWAALASVILLTLAWAAAGISNRAR